VILQFGFEISNKLELIQMYGLYPTKSVFKLFLWNKSNLVYLIMEKSNELAAKRFKQIREHYNLTQKQFAEDLEIRNTVADIERGRTKITGFTIAKLIQVYGINPMWLYGLSAVKLLQDLQVNTSPKVVTVNTSENENMVLVDVKAAAGYPSNVQEPHWYNELPAFNFPLPQFRNATFRGFQIQGDSMFPQFKPKEWVIAKAVDAIHDLTDNRVCVVVLKDSVLIKQLKKSSDSNYLTLISTNRLYPQFDVALTEVQEVWEVTSKLSFDIDDVGESANIHDLQLAMQRLSKEVNSLKNK